MLTRRLVAGPSRALVFRHLATAAIATEGVDLSSAPVTTASTSFPAPATPSSVSRITSRQRSATPTTSSTPARSPQVSKLLNLVACAPPTNAESDQHEEAWRMYRLLTRQERESLSAKELARILRTVVPRYHHYWKYLYRTPKRLHHRVLSVQVASEWEFRLRTVMGDLTATDNIYRDDWWFVLRTLSNMGLITACEAIVREMPDKLRLHPTTAEFRLGAVVRWSRNLIDTECTPQAAQVELAHEAFWEIFRHMKSTQIHTFTLRLLLSATAEVSTLLKSTQNDESIARMSELVNFIVKEGYGIDLNNIPMSVQQISQSNAALPRLSAKGLSAVLRHLVLRDIDPQRLVSAFDVLSVKESATVSSYSSRVDEEDEDDFGLTMTSEVNNAQDVDPDRRNWLGLKVRKATSNSPPVSESTTDSLAYDVDVPQGRRYRLEFLPQIPSLHTMPSPQTDIPLPPAANYNDEGVVVMLKYLRQRNEPRLFTHVLETAIYDAKAAQSAWLPAYVACAPERRAELLKPLRIAPEWIRIALAYSDKNYGRWSARFAQSANDALEWTKSFTDIIVQTETERGTVITSRANASASPTSRPSVLTPEFAANPRVLRMLRNAHVFVVSESIKTLYHDIDELEALSVRGKDLQGRRQKWRT